MLKDRKSIATSVRIGKCFRRQRRLDELGVITGYEARLDPARLGFGVAELRAGQVIE